jgi:hypothetical protein
MRILFIGLFLLFCARPVPACKPGEVVAGVFAETVSVVSSPELYNCASELKKIFEQRNTDILVHVSARAGREFGFALR